MKLIPEFAIRRRTMVSTFRLGLVLLTCAGGMAALIAGLQRLERPLSRTMKPPVPIVRTGTPVVNASPGWRSMPRTAFAPTFADAAESLKAGRHAEAYGRFVALADEGDFNAARIALVLHRYGPEVFGSDWDASPEQLAEWTRQSAAAAEKELADLHAVTNGPSADKVADSRVLPCAVARHSR